MRTYIGRLFATFEIRRGELNLFLRKRRGNETDE